jgi:hypothetical protein
MSDIVILSTRDTTPGELLSRSDLSAFWIADRNCVREFLTDATFRVYLEINVPVIEVFESAVDAERLHRWVERQSRRARHAH